MKLLKIDGYNNSLSYYDKLSEEFELNPKLVKTPLGDISPYKEEEIQLDDIEIGDTIYFNGHWVTIGKTDIKTDNLMGKTIFGERMKIGRIPLPLKRMLFLNWIVLNKYKTKAEFENSKYPLYVTQR